MAHSIPSLAPPAREPQLSESLKPDNPAEVAQEGLLIEVAGQAVRTDRKPRKTKRSLPKQKKK